MTVLLLDMLGAQAPPLKILIQISEPEIAGGDYFPTCHVASNASLEALAPEIRMQLVCRGLPGMHPAFQKLPRRFTCEAQAGNYWARVRS